MYSKYINRYLPIFLTILVGLTGCRAQTPLNPIDPDIYASGSIYIYQPLNPTTIWIDPGKEPNVVDLTSSDYSDALLQDLDTETVRIALYSMSAKGGFTAGVVGTSVEGQSYTMVVDYIKYISINRKVDVKYKIPVKDGPAIEKTFKGNVPLYNGIGLRIRADFVATKTGLNISGLPALALASSTEGISGRLTVQTLGITGKEVTALMPIISDISITSIQNAVQAVAAIKSKIYESSTNVYPKIVGFESPTANPSLIRSITGYIYAIDKTICTDHIKVRDMNSNVQRPKIQISWFCANERNGKRDNEADTKVNKKAVPPKKR